MPKDERVSKWSMIWFLHSRIDQVVKDTGKCICTERLLILSARKEIQTINATEFENGNMQSQRLQKEMRLEQDHK